MFKCYKKYPFVHITNKSMCWGICMVMRSVLYFNTLQVSQCLLYHLCSAFDTVHCTGTVLGQNWLVFCGVLHKVIFNLTVLLKIPSCVLCMKTKVYSEQCVNKREVC